MSSSKKKSSSKKNIIKYIKKVYKDLKYENKEVIKKLEDLLKTNEIITNFDYEEDDLFLNLLQQSNDYTFEVYFLKEDKCPIKIEKEVIGIKSIKINKEILIKMIYQMYYTRHLNKTYFSFINYYKNDLNQYQIFENMKENNLYLKIIIKRKLKLKLKSNKEEYTNNYVKYIPQNDEEAYISSSLLFNKNSIDFLTYQDFKYYLHNKHIKNWDLMEHFRNSMNNLLPINNRFRTLFYSSTLLYFLGHRPNNDFDYMIFCDEKDSSFYIPFREFEINENKKYIKNNPKGMYDFSYINSGNAELTRTFYEEYYDIWAQSYGAKNFNEVRAFGKYHMYYLGIKSTTIKMDILRRRIRARPRSLADLIALRLKYGFKFTIPKPVEFATKFYKYNKISNNMRKNLIKKGGIIINTYNVKEIKINEPINMNKFYNTIQWALKTRYHIKMSIEDIKNNFVVVNNSNNKLLKFELQIEENKNK